MIVFEKSEGIWTITLNRPDKANALNQEMLENLCDITSDAKEARALILTGKGEVFSAGADLGEVKNNGLALSPLWERLSGQIANLNCLTIAALNGTAAGGSLGMVLACDLRLAVESARIFYPVMKLGILPQPSDPVRMRALIGPARTKLILMGGQKLEAQEAYLFGLLDRVCSAAALMSTAHALSESANLAKPEHAAAIKAICPLK